MRLYFVCRAKRRQSQNNMAKKFEEYVRVVVGPNAGRFFVPDAVGKAKEIVLSRKMVDNHMLGRIGHTFYRAAPEKDVIDFPIDDSAGNPYRVTTVHIDYTTLYLDHVVAWYYTGKVMTPQPGEAELFYTVLDFWGIPHDGKLK